LYLPVIASEAKQSILPLGLYGLLRFARNDDLLFVIAREMGDPVFQDVSDGIEKAAAYWILRFRGV
jgi:hypothetical protein